MDEESPVQRLAVSCVVDDLRTEGYALRRDLSRPERMRRAARSFGILFMIALFSVFIPVLHFVLPPLILIAAGVFAVLTYAEGAEVTGGEVSCPNCRRVTGLTVEAEEWPKTLRCAGCSFTLTIRPE